MFTEAQIISIAESIRDTDAPLQQAYEKASVILQETNQLSLFDILQFTKLQVFHAPAPPAPPAPAEAAISDLRMRCTVGLALVVADLKIREILPKDLKLIFEIVQKVFSSTNYDGQMKKAAKDIVLCSIAWYKKNKHPTGLPPLLLSSIPTLIQCLVSLNEVSVQNIDQLAVVWKKGIIGVLKMRGRDYLSSLVPTSASSSSSSSNNNSNSNSIATTTTSITTTTTITTDFTTGPSPLLQAVLSPLFQNAHVAVKQLEKELTRDADTYMETTSDLPPAFKLVRFWCTNLVTLSKVFPSACASVIASPQHRHDLLRLVSLIHPVYGVSGASKLSSSSMSTFILNAVTSTLHNILLQGTSSSRKLLDVLQPQEEPDVHDLSRLCLACEVLVYAQAYEEETRAYLYRWIAGDDGRSGSSTTGGTGGTGGAGGTGGTGGNKGFGGGMRTLIKRCYSQIVLLDEQILHLLERGVSTSSGGCLTYHHSKKTSEKTEGGGQERRTATVGVADWKNSEPTSVLLKLLGSIITFVATSPFDDQTDELCVHAMSTTLALLVDTHPAVAEIGATMLSCLVRRLSPPSTVALLSAIVTAVSSSFIHTSEAMLNSTSSSFSSLRAVQRSLSLLDEHEMNSFAQQCLKIPTLPPTAKNHHHHGDQSSFSSSSSSSSSCRELSSFLCVLQFVPMDSVAPCEHIAKLYTSFLPALVQSLFSLVSTAAVIGGTTKSAITYVPSLSTLRLSLCIVRRLTSHQGCCAKYMNSASKQLVKKLWEFSKYILPLLVKNLRAAQEEKIPATTTDDDNKSKILWLQEQRQKLLLLQTTISDVLGMLSTPVVLRSCPSAIVLLVLLRQMGQLMSGTLLLPSTKVLFGGHARLMLDVLSKRDTTWFEHGRKDETLSTNVHKAVRSIVEKLVGDGVGGGRDGGGGANDDDWTMFHCGLDVARSGLFALDMPDQTSISPAFLLPYLEAHIAGTSIPRRWRLLAEKKKKGSEEGSSKEDGSSGGSSLHSLSEDVLRLDESILLSTTTTGSEGPPAATASDDDISHHLLLSSSNSSRTRKLEEMSGVQQAERVSKRPRQNENLTTNALDVDMSVALQLVSGGLMDVQDLVNQRRKRKSTRNSQHQLEACVAELRKQLNGIISTSTA